MSCWEWGRRGRVLGYIEFILAGCGRFVVMLSVRRSAPDGDPKRLIWLCHSCNPQVKPVSEPGRPTPSLALAAIPERDL